MEPLTRSIPFLGLAGLALLSVTLGLVACDDGSSSPDGLPPGLGESAGKARDADAPPLHANIEAARAALRDDDPIEARRLLQAIPPTDRSYLVALRDLGTIHAALGEHQAALQNFTLLNALEPGNPEMLIAQSWSEFQLGDAAAAELSALRALEVAPDSIPARYNVAFFRLAQGDLAEASRAYHRAMKRDFAMDYVSRARDNLLRLQESRPDFADVHFALAAIANALGNSAEEIEELESYLQMEPEGPAVQVARERLEEARRKAGS